MSEIVEEMGGYLGDGSEFELPESTPGKLELQSTPTADSGELEAKVRSLIGAIQGKPEIHRDFIQYNYYSPHSPDETAALIVRLFAEQDTYTYQKGEV